MNFFRREANRQSVQTELLVDIPHLLPIRLIESSFQHLNTSEAQALRPSLQSWCEIDVGHARLSTRERLKKVTQHGLADPERLLEVLAIVPQGPSGVEQLLPVRCRSAAAAAAGSRRSQPNGDTVKEGEPGLAPREILVDVEAQSLADAATCQTRHERALCLRQLAARGQKLRDQAFLNG